METNDIRKKIEDKITFCKKYEQKCRKRGTASSYTTATEWYHMIKAFKEALTLIPKDMELVDEVRAKKWDAVCGWLSDNPDYILVKKKDLLTKEEISNLSRCCLANGSPTKEKETDKIFKKLKALSVKDNRFVTKKDLIGNNIVVKKK